MQDRLNETIGVLTRREAEARLVAPLVEALGAEFGRDKVLRVLRNAVVEIPPRQGADLPGAMGGNSLGHFRDSLVHWPRDDALSIEVIEESGQTFGFNRHHQGGRPSRGKVDSAEAKSAASSIAQGVEGAKSVKNGLQVVAPTARKAVDTSDSDIAKAVGSRLSTDTQLKKVDVRTDAGVVTLTGQVPTITASAKASEMARGVPGVK